MKTRLILATFAAAALLPITAGGEEVFDYTYFDLTYLDNGLSGTVSAVDNGERVDLRTGEGDGLGVRASFAVHPNFHVFGLYSGSNLDLNATHTRAYPSLDAMTAAFFTTPEFEAWDAACDLNDDAMINFSDLAMLKEATELGNDTWVESYAEADGDLTDLRLGVGYNTMLAPKVGAFAQVFWDSRDLDFASAQFMGENRDFGTDDNGIGAAVGLRGKVTDKLELNGRVTYTPDGDLNMLAETQSSVFSDDTLLAFGGTYNFTQAFSMSAEVEGDGDVQAYWIGARLTNGD